MNISKRCIELIAACFLCAQMCAMQKSPLTNFDRIWLKGFIEADKKNDSNFLKRKSDITLNKLVSVGTSLLADNSEFEALRKYIGLNMSKDELRLRLTNIVKNAKDALPKSVPQEEAIKIEKKPALPVKASAALPGSAEERRLNDYIKVALRSKENLINFISTHTLRHIEQAFIFSDRALASNDWISYLKDEFNIPSIKVRSLLEMIKQEIGYVLSERGYKNYTDKYKKKEKQSEGPWPDYPDSPR